MSYSIQDEFDRQLSMLPEDSRTIEARNAIFHELIGHDGHGYCRTYGRIVARSASTPQPSTIIQITQQVRAELKDELRKELREEMQAEFSTRLQKIRAKMMANVLDASSGHRVFGDSVGDETPYTPPPIYQV
ncbi:hypothetical protein ACSBR1_023935 [Camellia fascicularis]